jgi:choline kinase
MNIVILGDKFQKRMKSKGCVGLIKIDDKTNMLEHQYDILKNRFPKANIVYIYGFEEKKFEAYIDKKIFYYKDLVTIYNSSHLNQSSVFSLFMAKEYFNDNCLILFGDNPLKSSHINAFNENNGSQIFLTHKKENSLGCTLSENNYVVNIDYGLPNYLYDVFYLEHKHMSYLYNILNENNSYHNCFIFEIVNKIIDHPRMPRIKPFFVDKKNKTKSVIK